MSHLSAVRATDPHSSKTMDPESGKMVELAALGRPFSLGMLYDCRRDSLIPGLNLWNNEDLKRFGTERPQHYSFFEILASESIEHKTSSLNVEASLKASFLGGLVEVAGSANYLKDSKTSQNTARVTLQYKATTKFQELSMNQLGRGNLIDQNVFNRGIATHVVTGILYGAQAFFVFDRELSDEENRQDIEGSLKAEISKIPSIDIGGHGYLGIKDTKITNVEKFSCKFHGDFSLDTPPVSFQDAIQVYQSLPQLLGENGEKAIPLKVWLMPLTVLDSEAAQLVREISIGLVREAQSVLEDFSELELRCNDALKIPVTQQFPQISKKMRGFKELCEAYKLELQKTLAEKLPLIRGGGEEEGVLAEVLKRRHLSPFNNKDLSEWMDSREREINIISSLTSMMKNTKIVRQNELYNITLSSDHVVCFVFSSLQTADPYMSALSCYLSETPKQVSSQDYALQTHDVEKEQLQVSKEVTDTMKQKAKLFADFSEANKENKNIQFLTTIANNEHQNGASVYLYKEGVLLEKDFEPPSKPEKPDMSFITHNSVTLKMCPPRFGTEDIRHYSIEYCVTGQDDWQEETVPQADEVTVSNLTPNTEYKFRYRAVCSVGRGPASKVSDSFKTLPTSPPGKPQVEAYSDELSVNWAKPIELGDGVTVKSYSVEYEKVSSGMKNEQRNVQSKDEKVIIAGLEPLTKYVVRVRCECGVDGRSNESLAVTVQTTKAETVSLAEFHRRKSKPINSGSPSVYQLTLEINEMDIDGCKSYTFGKESIRRNRTIIVLGVTGAGKSTLINGMINYILGINWKDDYRFKVIIEEQSRSQTESQTSKVIAYKINHQERFKVPYSLTIVDTPGFGDTCGIDRDKAITEQIRSLFTFEMGVSEIDAVCFVTQASLPRLTPTQKYVFDSVLSIFGKDIADNIRMLVTFADTHQPTVLEAINASSVPCPKTEVGLPIHFKFNNSALFADNRSHSDCHFEEVEDTADENFDQMFWNMNMRSLKRFFDALDKMETQSLQLTKEVLKERKRLEAVVEGLQHQVKAGIAKLDEIRMTKQKIQQHEADISLNEEFEIEVEIIKPIQQKLTKSRQFITNCQQCSMTCHYPCTIEDNSNRKRCAAMNRSGNCNVCPGKCVWSMHVNQKYRWEYVKVKERHTLQELKDKYEKAAEAKMSTQDLFERQEEDSESLQDVIMDLMDKMTAGIARLNDIALRRNPLSTPEYIDLLIEGERTEANEGFLTRIQSLETMKERAKILSKVSKKDKLTTFNGDRQKDQKTVSVLKNITDFFKS